MVYQKPLTNKKSFCLHHIG